MQKDEKCIVTINGEEYDLTEFRKKHPGGDIFNFGSDMTAAFMANHGNDLKRLLPFKVKTVNNSEIIKTRTTKSTEIVDINESNSKKDSENPMMYSMKDLDKALQEELEEI